MSKTNSYNVNIILGEPDRQMRQEFRAALSNNGFKKILDFDTLQPVHDNLRNSSIDLVVLDGRMDKNYSEVAKLIKNVRFGNFPNPYTVIILTLWQPEQRMVQTLANSGADDIVVKPISAKQLADRILALGLHRKNFVCTSDYLGPDRRKDVSRGSEIEVFEVPNTLLSGMQGKTLPPELLAEEVKSASTKLNKEKRKRIGFSIAHMTKVLEGINNKKFKSITCASEMPHFIEILTEGSMRAKMANNIEEVAMFSDALTIAKECLKQNRPNATETQLNALKKCSEQAATLLFPDLDRVKFWNDVDAGVDAMYQRVELS